MKLMYLMHNPRSPEASRSEPALHQRLTSYVSTDTEVEIHYPEDYPGAALQKAMARQKVLNGLNHVMESPQLIRKAVEAQEEGFDAVVQGNNFDPAVEASRLAVSIPVVGALKTSVHVVGMLARRVGFFVPFETHIGYVTSTIESYGLGRMIAGVRAMGVYSGGSDDELLARALTCSEELATLDRAEYIVPLGGALIPARIEPEEISSKVGLPVLNTVATVLRTAESLVRLGMTHSPVTYPRADVPAAVFDRRLADPEL